MKKTKTLFFAFFLLLFSQSFTQSPSYHWFQPSPLNREVFEIDYDDQGNVYTSGIFTGQVVFGNDTLTTGSGASIYLIKRDLNGNIIWARQFGGSSTDIVYDMKVDHLGYIYLTGNTRSAMTVLGTTFTANQYGDFFLLKYAPNGTMMWVVSAGTSSGEGGNGIGFDVNGDVYVAFYMANSFNFAGIPMQSLNGASGGVAKFSPNGQILWANNYGREYNYNSTRDIAVLPNGDHYLLGQYDASVVFGTDTLTGVDDTWVAKFDSAGNYQWSRSLQGSGFDTWYAVDAAPNGDVYLVGDFADTLNLGGNTYVAGGQSDIVFTRYDASGNLLGHSVHGGPGVESAQDLAVNPNGDFFVTGEYSPRASLGGGILTTQGSLMDA